MNSHSFTLERGGKVCQLVKHPRDRKLPPAEQAARPWYIRLSEPGQPRTWKKVGEAHETEAAVTAARDLLLKARAGGNPFTELYDAGRYRGTVTVGAIIDKWVASGYAEPNGRARPAAQAKRHAQLLGLASKTGNDSPGLVSQWFADKRVSQVNEPMLVKYAQWRRAKVRQGYTGDRTIDQEMNMLTQCFYWATAAGEADKNPFIERPRFQNSAAVHHACDYMPSNDDELHRIAGWLIATGEPANIIAGAQLLFMALTGLRSGEPGFMRWKARYTDAGPECGHRFERTLEGKTTELLAIHRLKGGINPAIQVRSALASFISAWQPYCRMHWPNSPFWFPHVSDITRPFVLPQDPSQPLNWRLEIAAKALGLPKRKAHAMRAFYVRARRSEGASDSAIAEELGQGSGPALIVSAYGAADQIRGDGRFDWLPSGEKDAPPVAWTRFDEQLSNVIAL